MPFYKVKVKKVVYYNDVIVASDSLSQAQVKAISMAEENPVVKDSTYVADVEEISNIEVKISNVENEEGEVRINGSGSGKNN